MTAHEQREKPNRLSNEKSPYLLQHAYNPVDWYPWGEEAFKKAEEENKPIFLSIGYSTCHWCHVMAHESFEDPEVARLMNEAFVNIKVDREERPDIDGVYMEICQLMTGRGGWPLNIIMTPDRKPFFAATYIPRDSRAGQPGLQALIPRFREYWLFQKAEIRLITGKIMDALAQSGKEAPGFELTASLLDSAYDALAGRFDDEYGGFGRAPKFPSPHNLLFLLRYWRRTGNEKALHMVEKTLRAMRQGGIFDQVGFGFHRYSTDHAWLVPHFEKMLYDQALLSIAYTEAYQVTGKHEYEQTAREILTYVLRDMTSPEGGFFSGEDADSEGEEGKFYLWSREEIGKVLGEKDGALALRIFNVEHEGNFLEESTGRKVGTNILYLKKSLQSSAEDEGMEVKELEKALERIRKKLFAYRKKRVHPHKDDKILTDWNGLMIAALAKAAGVFGDHEYEEAASKAVDFILKKLRIPRGRLLHRYRDGKAGIPAMLDDYVFFIWGLLELYEATFTTSYLTQAIELNRDMVEHFWDSPHGGLYITPDYGEELIWRKKEIYDGAVPSGNSVAMMNLLRLARITGNRSLEEKAIDIGRAFSRPVTLAPHAHTHLMLALDFVEGPSYEVVVAGRTGAESTKEILHALQRLFVPDKVVIFRPTEDVSPYIVTLAPFVREYRDKDGKAVAYVCHNHICKAPLTSAAELQEFFRDRQAAHSI